MSLFLLRDQLLLALSQSELFLPAGYYVNCNFTEQGTEGFFPHIIILFSLWDIFHNPETITSLIFKILSEPFLLKIELHTLKTNSVMMSLLEIQILHNLVNPIIIIPIYNWDLTMCCLYGFKQKKTHSITWTYKVSCKEHITDHLVTLVQFLISNVEPMGTPRISPV